jgi:hypothetical protein
MLANSPKKCFGAPRSYAQNSKTGAKDSAAFTTVPAFGPAADDLSPNFEQKSCW